MKTSFYNPVHYASDNIKAQGEMLNLNLRNIRSVIINNRIGESLVRYRNGESVFVRNAVGRKIATFLGIRDSE